MTNKIDIERIEEETETSYSWDRYSRTGWTSTIRYLAKHEGLNDDEIILFMNSKHMRWAGDSDEKRRYGYLNANTVKEYIAKSKCWNSAREMIEDPHF